MNGTDELLLDDCDEQKRSSVHIVISAYRSLLTPISYVSMPITTGKLYYEVLEKIGSDISKKQIYDLVIKPNGEQGVKFAKEIKTTYPIVAPAIFEAKQMRWTERQYMYLWYRILEEKAKEIWMSPDWQYSNGCAEEFTRSMKLQWDFVRLESRSLSPITAFDAESNKLTIFDGAKLLYKAIKDLHQRNHICIKLVECLHELVNYAGAFYTYGINQGWECPDEVDYGQMVIWAEETKI